MEEIKQVTIVTQAGARSYTVGESVDGKIINSISKKSLYFTGDPFDHYIGNDQSGQMIFSINCLCPCEIIYN